jgi:hypothetical protein
MSRLGYCQVVKASDSESETESSNLSSPAILKIIHQLVDFLVFIAKNLQKEIFIIASLNNLGRLQWADYPTIHVCH